jgi:hypothetical protein
VAVQLNHTILWGREINHDGGRGVSFADPAGHLLEGITRPYRSSG